MVAIGIATVQGEASVAQAEAPEFERVVWYRDRGLRHLYFWAAILCVASATTGYDGYVDLKNRLYQRSWANQTLCSPE